MQKLAVKSIIKGGGPKSMTWWSETFPIQVAGMYPCHGRPRHETARARVRPDREFLTIKGRLMRANYDTRLVQERRGLALEQ